MNRSESFPIDIADRADVRAKLPRARAILTQRDRALKEALDDMESWKTLVELMEHIAGADDESDDDENTEGQASEQPEPQGSPPVSGPITVDFSGVETLLDAVVRTVTEQNRPIRSREVAELLRGEPQFARVQNDAVSNSLYYAAERADPRRVNKLPQRGVYAPLLPQNLNGDAPGPDPTMRSASPTAGLVHEHG
jgi:hypothetical protein